MALTAEETTQLAELKTARHSLLTGRRVSQVQYEGETLSFSKIDLPALERMIATLEAKEGGNATRRRPLQGIL